MTEWARKFIVNIKIIQLMNCLPFTSSGMFMPVLELLFLIRIGMSPSPRTSMIVFMLSPLAMALKRGMIVLVKELMASLFANRK